VAPKKVKKVKKISSKKTTTKRRSSWPPGQKNSGTGPHGPVNKSGDDFFVVCVGASAGGLEAFKEFLKNIPEDSNMSFVFIQHLSPKHKSLLPEILSRLTPIKVLQATHKIKIQRNHLYVIPPDSTMFYKDGQLLLTKRNPEEKPHHPIDRFMESMAYELGERAIGIVLSGTGSDGAEGTRLIKAEGGLSFAQSPTSAAYDSMPTKAITTDDIDFILEPRAIALEIVNIASSPKQDMPSHKDDIGKTETNDFSKIMLMLKQSAGTDFTQYKPTTIRRRISRRMLLLKCQSLKEYVKFLQNDPTERTALHNDVLINVTTFFREPETYDYLKSHILPTILKHKHQGQPLRIWSAGCSTGEETYSIAMCVLEVMGSEANPSTVQIFATDLSEKCIDKARAGKYFDYINEHVSDERLNKFFTKADGGYRISKQVRDICIFAKHDLTRDPAYSKLDIISCKNLMIYFGQELQTKVLENFHYSLNPNGFMCLGSSESLGKANELFQIVDPKLKVYVKKHISSRFLTHPASTQRNFFIHEAPPVKKQDTTTVSSYEIQTEADRAILNRYAPPSVIINSQNEILQFRGPTDQYLAHRQGEASLNIFKMSREGISSELKTIISKARSKDSSVRSGLVVLNGISSVTMEAIPLKYLAGERLILIVFETAAQIVTMPNGAKKGKTAKNENPQFETIVVSQLKQELSTVKDNLQTVIQDFENANQELQSANEEVLSSNEELQSTNEELETSKEELQSTNEELSTVNDELQIRNQELFSLNNDLVNVLNSVQIPIMIVGNDLTIRRYTPSSSKVFNLIPTDVGRPFAHVSSNVVQVQELVEMVKDVIEHSVLKEKEIQSKDGKWFNIRVRPYKTEEQKIEGVVITLQENIDVKNFISLTSVILDIVKQPFVILDRDLCVTTANNSFYTFFNLKPKAVEKSHLTDVADYWGTPKFKNALDTVMKGSRLSVIEPFTFDIPKHGKKKLNVTIHKIANEKLTPTQVLISFEEL
jgi:two-component system CheB/CheR fusion protein